MNNYEDLEEKLKKKASKKKKRVKVSGKSVFILKNIIEKKAKKKK